MKFLLMKTLMVISSIISMMKTPMSMGILLILYTIISTVLISNIMVSSWIAMITFLMFIGGLLILFMYMSSIASNEKFNSNLYALFAILLLIIPTEELMVENHTNDLQNSTMLVDSVSLSKMYNMKTFLMTIMLFLYMYLSLIMVTKIIKIYSGPLRSSMY